MAGADDHMGSGGNRTAGARRPRRIDGRRVGRTSHALAGRESARTMARSRRTAQGGTRPCVHGAQHPAFLCARHVRWRSDVAVFLRGGFMKNTIARNALALLFFISAGLVAAQELPDMSVARPRPAGPPPNATVEQPRAFGHVIGDVLTQRVLLQLDGQPFTPAPLPRAERVGPWLERRTLRMATADDGRRWLIAEFQIVNAPTVLMATVIPAWELRPASGQNALRMPAWPISIAPLTPLTAFGEGALEDLRPDRAAPLVATAPIKRQLTLFAGACVASLGLWLAWWLWLQWRASSTQPFARAMCVLRKLDDASPKAWYALHRAFDETAGEALHSATLADLFRRAPYLAPQREAIKRFFAQSNERFFGKERPANSFPVRKLCAELRRLEKRHEA